VDKGARGRSGITIPCSGNPPLCARTWAKYPTATVIAITQIKMRTKARVPEDGFIVDLLRVVVSLLVRGAHFGPEAPLTFVPNNF
jgi:hypothetical protein